MVHPATTRRNAVFALVAICLLVCGGLAWATYTGLRLETIEAESNRERARSVQEKANLTTLALALAHLDGIVDSVLAVERTRPFEHYRAFYKPATTIDLHSGLSVDPAFVVPSPLREFTGPDWVLLHFQVSVTHGWSSPQLDDDVFAAVPAGAIPADDRARQASGGNWLAALRDHCDPFQLQQLLEQAQQAEIDRNAAIARFGSRDESTPGARSSDAPRARIAAADRTATEFARRGQRLLEMQRLHMPAEQCEPWSVATDNLQMGQPVDTSANGAATCVKVWGTPMQGIWLDLTLDGKRQLALVRSVSVEQSEFCTLQGVLIDWERLQRMLESEIQDMLPGAKIEPAAVGAPFDATALRTLPARLIGTIPSSIVFTEPTHGWTWGLGLTWSATLLALSALCWGTMKYVGMVERRMQFVAAVTHELRTPLTAFQLYTDLLADHGDDGRKREQFINTLRQESQRLARLVENVLVYSRMGDARPKLNAASIDPQAVLDAIELQTRSHCASSGKQLVLDNRCGGEHRVHTDAEFVVQILANLVENACKYSSGAADPRVWVTARPWSDGGVAFEVEDLGAGVAAADRRAVFKPFRRSVTAADQATTGMGLGLALSRYWASCLGGRLDLKRGEHNGSHFTRFSLCLPARHSTAI